jgi:hypothetical protein
MVRLTFGVQVFDHRSWGEPFQVREASVFFGFLFCSGCLDYSASDHSQEF